MSAQLHVYRVVDRYMTFAGDYLASRPTAVLELTGQKLDCRATTRKGTPCQRMPLPHNGYCPSHQHLAETEEVLWPPRRLPPCSSASTSAGRSPTPSSRSAGGWSPRRRRRRRTTSPRACSPPCARRWSAPGADAGDVEAFAHGTTVATNALLEGKRRADRPRRHRGLRGRRGARPPGARRPLPAVRRPPGAARPARAARGRARAHDARTARCAPLEDPAARRGATVAAHDPEAVAVCLLHAYRHPEHEQALGRGARRAAPRRPRLALPRGRRHVPRVRARGHDRARRRALPPARRLPRARWPSRARDAGLPVPDVMQSSGGLATLDQARAHAALTVLSGPGRRRRGRGVGGARVRGARRAVLRHGRHVVRRLRDRGRRGAGDRRPAGRRAAGGAADARPPHGRRRRRLDRLARRRRRAARRARSRPARGPGRPPTGTAAPSRRSPTRTSCSGCSARAPLAGAIALDRDAAAAAVERLADELGLDAPGDRGGDPPRRERRDGPRAARDDRGARRRPARRSRSLAFGGAGPLHADRDRRGARHDDGSSARARRACSPRSGLVVSERRRDVQRSVLLSGGDADGGRGWRRRSPRWRELGERRVARRRRPALPRPGVRAGGRHGRSPDPDELREAFAAAHEQAYGFRDPDGEVELVTLRVTTTAARPVHRPGGRGRRTAAARRARRAARSSAARSTRPPCSPGSRSRAPTIDGPRDLRAARGDARRAAGLVGRRRATSGTIRLEARG